MWHANSTKCPVDRRTFLRGLGVGLGTLSMAGLPLSQTWHSDLRTPGRT